MERIHGLTDLADRRVGRCKHSPDAAKMNSLNSTSPVRLGAVLALAIILTGAASNQVYAGNGSGAAVRSGIGSMPAPTASFAPPSHVSPRSAPVAAPQPGPVSAGSGAPAYGQSAGSSFGATNGGLYPASGYGSSNPVPIYGPPVPTAQPPAQPYPASVGGSGYAQNAGWGYGTTGSYYPATTYNSADYAPASTAATACPMAMYASAPYAGASAAPQAPPLYAPSSYANSCATVPSYPSYPR